MSPVRKKSPNNLSFIATYLFQYPGSSASDVRRALFLHKRKRLSEDFNEKKSYISYFQQTHSKSYRGYVPRYWNKVNRCRWTLTSEGLFLVDKRLIKKVDSINKRLYRMKAKNKRKKGITCRKVV